MMRMVPPGYTSEQAVHLRRLRYADLPASTSTPHQGGIQDGSQGPRGNGEREPGEQSGPGSNTKA